MEENLFEMLEEFKKKIDIKNDTSRQYLPILRDWFIPFILNNYQCKNLKSLFCDEMTRNGIINSAIYFIENNENIRSKSRLNFFLSSLNSLFNELLFEKYPNPNIQKLQPFTSLMDDICDMLNDKGINLNDPESNPSINKNQFSYIINFLKEFQAKSTKNKQEHILIKLYLLYGISSDKLAALNTKSFSYDRKVLKVPCSIRKDLFIDLELPYSLANEINDYLTEDLFLTNKFLFEKTSNKKIDSSFLSDILEKIKLGYWAKNINTNCNNPFTPTGLQKYAIIKMIESGMNQSLIMDFTGQSQIIFNDCQNAVDESKKLNRNRYINHMIRGIDTYDNL